MTQGTLSLFCTGHVCSFFIAKSNCVRWYLVGTFIEESCRCVRGLACCCVWKRIHRKWNTMRIIILTCIDPTSHNPINPVQPTCDYTFAHYPFRESHIWRKQLSPIPVATASPCTLKSYTHSVLYTLSFFCCLYKDEALDSLWSNLLWTCSCVFVPLFACCS